MGNSVLSQNPWTEVSYYSDGLKISGYLYTPRDWDSGNPDGPAIVTLAGYTGMKDIYGLDVPRRLHDEGYFVLAIDNRGFGKSEGERGRQRPLEQAQDTYDALTYLETVSGVDPDRLGLYGTSAGGATAIWAAAFDERIKVVVTSVGVSDGERTFRLARRPHEWAALQKEVSEAARRRVTTGEPTHCPVTHLMVTDPHTDSVFSQFDYKEHDLFVPDFDLESAEAMWRFKPEWVAHQISPRATLVIRAEDDMLVPVEESLELYRALREPKKLVTLPKAQHYDSYFFVNPEIAEISMQATLDWYEEHL